MYINNDMSTKGNSDFGKKNEKTIAKYQNRNLKYWVQRIIAPITLLFYCGAKENKRKGTESKAFN